ncbi:gamma-D-glutamyl-meso-diaminopimelate amidase, partial [Citrobacter youngae]
AETGYRRTGHIKKSCCRFNWSTQQLCENMGLRRFFE